MFATQIEIDTLAASVARDAPSAATGAISALLDLVLAQLTGLQKGIRSWGFVHPALTNLGIASFVGPKYTPTILDDAARTKTLDALALALASERSKEEWTSNKRSRDDYEGVATERDTLRSRVATLAAEVGRLTNIEQRATEAERKCLIAETELATTRGMYNALIQAVVSPAATTGGGATGVLEQAARIEISSLTDKLAKANATITRLEEEARQQHVDRVAAETGFALSPYTILHGGHVVDDLDFNDGDSAHSGSLLAVPQDPIIKVILPHRKRTLSVGRFDVNVSDLKQMLHEEVGARSDRLLIFGRNGKLLQDASKLNSCDCFTRHSTLICRPQLDEYFNFVQPNERLSSVLKHAEELQQDWCVTKDFGDLPSKICQELTGVVTAALNSNQQKIHPTAALKSSSYDRFVADFPTKKAPKLIGSVALMKMKEEYAKAHGRSSKCPTAAKVAAEAVITKFSSKNVKLADGVEACLQHLLSPIVKLSAKDPMIHDHADRKRKIKHGEMALNRYRDIRAGKMYDKPEQCQDKLDAIQALYTEMSQIIEHFSEFHAEWEAAKRWSDLTVFDRVEAESLKPATARVSALVESAAKRVKEESERLEALRRLESDAAHHDLLIQNQVRWCKEVVKSAQESTEEDIQDIDNRIRELLTERAAKELLRASLQQRMTSLDEQANTEATNFQRFKAQYAAKEAIVRERLDHAKLGSDVVKEFQQVLANLQATVVAEIQELRRKAEELRVDVAADCSEAYKVAHSVNFILKHYEEEETLKSNEEEKVDLSKKYQMAMVQMRTDRAQDLKMQVDAVKVKIDESLAKIRECAEAIASLDQRVAEPWAFVCQHGVGGPKPPLQTGRVVVRTSEANMAAWDGEDRALERPDEWNQEMKAEAEAFKNQLMLAFGN